MDFTIPQSLKNAIEQQNCVPFVGAGLSMTILRADNGERLFCSWHDLLMQTVEMLKQDNKQDAANVVSATLNYTKQQDRYYRAAEIAKTEMGNEEWNRFLKQAFNPLYSLIEPSSLATAKQVWQLGSQLVITTNYDKVLQWATDNNPDSQTINIDAEFELAQLNRTEAKVPTIMHLHGSVDNINKIVLTPDGYQKLYGDDFNQAQHQAALETFKKLLASKTMLFIGFSFADQTFYHQIKLIDDIFDGNGPKHYVLCRHSEKEAIDRLQLPLETVCFDQHENLPKLLSQLSVDGNSADSNPPTEQQPQQATTENISLDNNVFFIPFRAKGDAVVGREDKLQQLAAQLQSGKQTSIGHATGFKGMGGVGKTQLAIEYAHRYQNDYPKGVIWLTADQDIEPQLIACAKKAKWVSTNSEDKDSLAIAKHRITSYSDCLIIFDNVEQLDDIKAYLPNIDANPHLLLTSRNIISGFDTLDLDSLSQQHSLTLLCNEAGKQVNELSDDELTAANTLCEQLGHLPLALEIAGAHIKKRPRYTFASYLATYEQSFDRATTSVNFDSFTKHEQCLISTLSLSDEIIQQHPTLIKIMQVLAYSANASMGEGLLKAMLKPSAKVENELLDSLDLGIELNLIKTSNQASENPRYSLHRLVKRVQLELTPFAQNLTWCQQLSTNMIEWFKPIRAKFEHLALYQQEQPHLEIWAQQAKQRHWQTTPALIWLQVYPPYHLGDFRKAKRLLEQAQTELNQFEQLQQSEIAAHLLNDFSSVLKELGDYQLALEYCQQALDLRLTLFGDSHPDVATSYANLSARYGNLGQYDLALKYCQQALDLHLTLFGDTHPDVATSYGNLSICYRDLGQYDLALKYCQQALDLRLTLFGDTHPDVAIGYCNLSTCYLDLGQYDLALEYCQQALDLRLTLFGDSHPCVAYSYTNLSGCYRDLGQYDLVLKYCQQALDLRLTLFGDSHPEVALNYMNLGACYYDLKQFETALNYEQKAFKLYLNLLGPTHPDTLHCLKNKQYTLVALNHFQPAITAIEQYRQQLTKTHAFLQELNENEKWVRIKAAEKGFSIRKQAASSKTKNKTQGKKNERKKRRR